MESSSTPRMQAAEMRDHFRGAEHRAGAIQLALAGGRMSKALVPLRYPIGISHSIAATGPLRAQPPTATEKMPASSAHGNN